MTRYVEDYYVEGYYVQVEYVSGTMEVSLQRTEANVVASHGPTASLSGTVGDAVVAVSANYGTAGTIDSSTEGVSASLDAQHIQPVTGELGATLSANTAEGEAVRGVAGTQAEILAGASAEIIVLATDKFVAYAEPYYVEDYYTTTELGQGAIQATLQPVTVEALGEHYASATGSLNSSLDDTTSTINSSHGVAGSLNATLDEVAPQVEGEHISPTIGDIAIGLQNTTADIDGDISTAGSIDVFAEETQASFGGAVGRAGDLQTELGGAESAIAVTHGVGGEIGVSFDATTAVVSGQYIAVVVGDISRTLGDTTAILAGEQFVRGDLVVDLDGTTADVVGQLGSDIDGAIEITLSAVDANLAARVGVQGDFVTSNEGTGADIVGAVGQQGDVFVVLEETAGEWEGTHGRAGEVEASLDATEVESQGEVGTAGTVEASLDAISLEIDATHDPARYGDVATVLGDVESVLGAAHGVSGAADAALEAATAQGLLAHIVPIEGTAEITLEATNIALTSDSPVRGVMGDTLADTRAAFFPAGTFGEETGQAGVKVLATGLAGAISAPHSPAVQVQQIVPFVAVQADRSGVGKTAATPGVRVLEQRTAVLAA